MKKLDGRILTMAKRKSNVGKTFSSEKALREYMGSAVPQGQENCMWCGRLKRKGKPCVCDVGGVFG